MEAKFTRTNDRQVSPDHTKPSRVKIPAKVLKDGSVESPVLQETQFHKSQSMCVTKRLETVDHSVTGISEGDNSKSGKEHWVIYLVQGKLTLDLLNKVNAIPDVFILSKGRE